MKRPTALDVARRAGVSRTTVSFVLNGQSRMHGIAEGTTVKVLRAAEEIGYVPHLAARALRSGRSNLALFLVPGTTALGELAAATLSTLADSLAEHGLDLVIRRTEPGRPFEDMWRDLAPALVMGMNVDPAEVARMQRADVVAVSFDFEALDRRAGAVQARHLLDRGHVHLAYAGPVDPQFSGFAGRRRTGVAEAAAARGVPRLVDVAVGIDLPSAVEAVRSLRERRPAVTGVAAFNDDHAFALLAGIARLGLEAPGDLAVIGVDDSPLGAVSLPALTSVDLRMETFISSAMASVSASGPNADGGGAPVIEPVVVPRDSG